jgi:hypothetical protein
MTTGPFLCGVIEGFYGAPWSFENRVNYAAYLSQLGLNTYLYCPKGDPFLRRRWPERWPDEVRQQLHDLGRTYREQGLHWGVGLSPFELYREYGDRQRGQLRAKMEELETLEAPLLGVLFDDMPGDQADLAARQAEIIADIFRWYGGSRILVCPTYYSFDPVLEKHFGAMPDNYWQTLGRELPRAVDILWTGNRVCSDTVTVADIELINAQVGRPVMLWDNYPVNDGAVRSKFLYCDKAAGREQGLDGVLSGHLSNPMNQALLSLPALAGLSALYGFRDYDEDWLSRVLGVQTWEQLRRDRGQFRDSGLEGMDAQERELLAQRYAGLPGQAAQEVAGWLLGQYTFDPACLTD